MMALRFMPAGLVALLIAALQMRAGTELSVALAVAAGLFAYVVMTSGRLLLRFARTPALGPAADYVLGLVALCLALLAVTTIVPITAATGFLVLAFLVIAAELAFRRRDAVKTPDWNALTGFALCAGMTAAWCYGPAAAYESLRQHGVLPLWSDYFFHGGLISQFSDEKALGRGSIYLVDHAPSFYHFASYTGAAALAGMLQLPGLPAATAAWLPLGFLAMLAGAYTLGTRLGGVAGGLAALAALAIVPDAANYGLRNGWFSFHFTLVAHAGATYALGAAFLSLSLLDEWTRHRVRAALAASAALAGAIALFRLHIFLLYLPAWLATAILSSAPEGRRRAFAWLIAVALGVGAAAGGLLIAHLADTGTGHWRIGAPALGRFLTIVHEWQEPTAYTGLYADLAEYWPPLVALLGGVALSVLAALGGLVVLLPLAAVFAGRARALRPIDSACMYLLYCWLLLMLYAPTPWHGEASDLIHRPFVLAYAAAAMWTLWLPLRVLEHSPARKRILWPAMLACTLGGLAVTSALAHKTLAPKFTWGQDDAAVRVPAGLVEAAAFLRAHAVPGDIFAPAGVGRGYVTFDLGTQLCSLTGMPAYLSRPHLEMSKDEPRKRVVEERLAALERIQALADYRMAMQALRSANVQWYVVSAGRGPHWDPAHRRALFRSGTVAVYSVASFEGDARADER